MCGLAGALSAPDELAAGSAEIARRMIGALSHRGPDEQRVVNTPVGSMAFARLALVGSSEGASQPQISRDGRFLVVCNGEIYNYQALNQQFGLGVDEGASDCAVLPELLARYGVESLKKIEGQFAFAALDIKSCVLHLGRDRFGIHPLFYAQTVRGLYFASECKAIFATGVVKPKIDPIALADTAVMYGATPPRSTFIGIDQVPPGELISLDLNTKRTSRQQFWEPSLRDGPTSANSPAPTPDDVLDRLRTAVQKRLQGHALGGVYVSGGLDSSIIAALVKEQTPEAPLFAIEFSDEPRIDESEARRSLGRELKAEIRTSRSSLHSVMSELPRLLTQTEAPLTRLGPGPFLQLAALASASGCKYVLSGEGADEAFLGYPVFASGRPTIASKWNDYRLLRSMLAVPQQGGSSIHATGSAAQAPFCGDLTSAQGFEVSTKLSRYLLSSQSDRVSLAHGLECRYPYLDEDLWVTLQTAPLAYDDKALLRDVAVKLGLQAASKRPKVGYLPPSSTPLLPILDAELARAYLRDDVTRDLGYFDGGRVKAMLDEVQRNLSRPSEQVVAAVLFVLTTHLLHFIFVEGRVDHSRLP